MRTKDGSSRGAREPCLPVLLSAKFHRHPGAFGPAELPADGDGHEFLGHLQKFYDRRSGRRCGGRDGAGACNAWNGARVPPHMTLPTTPLGDTIFPTALAMGGETTGGQELLPTDKLDGFGELRFFRNRDGCRLHDLAIAALSAGDQAPGYNCPIDRRKTWGQANQHEHGKRNPTRC